MAMIHLEPQTAQMFSRALGALKPPPNLTLSQWADNYRRLSAEASAAQGRWNTDNAPFQREIMDAIGDVHIRKVVAMMCAQSGKTDGLILNTIGYYMSYYPAPIMIVQPTVNLGESFSKDRLATMIRDTPVLRGLAVSNKANISITVDPQMQALAKLVKAEIEKHNANADAHAATITAAVSAAVKNLSESGEILNEEQVKALIKEQVDGGTGGGYYGSYKLTLAADEWKPARSEDDYENAGGMDYYQCIYDAELSDSTSELVPVGVVSPGSFYTTTKAGVLNGCETHDGFIRFFAQRIPEADIQATVTLFGKGGGSGETGSVSIGQGLKRDASGAIAVRIGEGLDFDSANALTVRKETVMTSEDLLDEEETQQEIVDMLK